MSLSNLAGARKAAMDAGMQQVSSWSRDLRLVSGLILLAFALKTLDVGPAYALWAGLGTVGAAIGGWLVFSERMNLLTVAGIAIVIVGVVAITLGESRA